MLELIEIDIQEFKKEIKSYYKKLFPVMERKPVYLIKRMYKKGFTKLLKIVLKEKIIGFFIINEGKTGYAQMDYFAIFKEYQSQGYGTTALNLIKKKYENSKGIFIEIEKEGLGKNEEENKMREKRAKFYERIGFEKLDFDVFLYGVIYTPYLLKGYGFDSKDNIKNELFEFYYITHRKNVINRNCRVV